MNNIVDTVKISTSIKSTYLNVRYNIDDEDNSSLQESNT